MARKVLTCDVCPDFTYTYVAELRRHQEYNAEHRAAVRKEREARHAADALEQKRKSALSTVAYAKQPLITEDFSSIDEVGKVVSRDVATVIFFESDKLRDAINEFKRELERVAEYASRNIANIAKGYTADLTSLTRRAQDATGIDGAVSARKATLASFCSALKVRTSVLEPAEVTKRCAEIAKLQVIASQGLWFVMTAETPLQFDNEGDAAIAVLALADAFLLAEGVTL